MLRMFVIKVDNNKHGEGSYKSDDDKDDLVDIRKK